MNKLPILLVIVIALSGCTTSTPYQAYDPNTRIGYLATKMAEGVLEIRFKGNDDTSQAQAHDFALLRAAEIAKENGTPFFVIIGDNDIGGRRNVSPAEPGAANPKQSYWIPATDMYQTPSQPYQGSAFPPISSAQTKTDCAPIPAYSLLIKVFKVRPSTTEKVYAANELIIELRKKYRLKESNL